MKEIIKELAGWLLYIVLIIALTWTVVTFVGQRTEVSGSSMETTLSDKDQLIVDKMTYRFRDPKRYDIVVFPYQYQDNTYQKSGSHEPAPDTAMSGTFLHISRSAMPVFSRSIP